MASYRCGIPRITTTPVDDVSRVGNGVAVSGWRVVHALQARFVPSPQTARVTECGRAIVVSQTAYLPDPLQVTVVVLSACAATGMASKAAARIMCFMRSHVAGDGALRLIDPAKSWIAATMRKRRPQEHSMSTRYRQGIEVHDDQDASGQT